MSNLPNGSTSSYERGLWLFAKNKQKLYKIINNAELLKIFFFISRLNSLLLQLLTEFVEICWTISCNPRSTHTNLLNPNHMRWFSWPGLPYYSTLHYVAIFCISFHFALLPFAIEFCEETFLHCRLHALHPAPCIHTE